MRRAAVLVAVCCACGGTEPSALTVSDVVVCPAGPTVEGIDVSKYDGTVDWNAVRAAGRSFGIARVSDGLDYPDAYFDANWSGMKAAGLVRGSYQYFEPAQDPIAQANLVLQHVGTLGAGDLAPVLDIETMGGQTASAVLSAIDQWAAAIKNATGRTPIVYANRSFWDGVGDAPLSEDAWIANWTTNCPNLPDAWTGWKFWQYSATGTVAGLSNLDLDRFNGSDSDLAAYAGVPPPPPPAPTTAITSPASGATVTGTVTITASATNATTIEIYADGALLASAASVAWDTTRVADGAHQLQSKAYGSSVVSSAIVSVTVQNAQPVQCPPGTVDVGGTCVPQQTGCSTDGAGFGFLAALIAAAFAAQRARSH